MQQATTPPAVPARSGPGALPGQSGLNALCAAGAGAVLAVIVARGMLDGRILYPGCGFRWLTGHPCPGCGGTHALASLGAGDVAAGLVHNPLVALVAIGLVLAALAALFDRFATRGCLAVRIGPRVRAALQRTGTWAIAAVLTNWAYLLWKAS